jgi:hypothetical protein
LGGKQHPALKYSELKKIYIYSRITTNSRSRDSCRDLFKNIKILPHVHSTYIECPRRNVPNYGRVFLMLKYTDITQNTYVQS